MMRDAGEGDCGSVTAKGRWKHDAHAPRPCLATVVCLRAAANRLRANTKAPDTGPEDGASGGRGGAGGS